MNSSKSKFVRSNCYVHHRRNSLHLKDYDYSIPGPYFITICTRERLNLCDRTSIRDSVIEIIKHEGSKLSTRIHCVVIAIDHIHGLLGLPEDKNVTLSKFVAIIKVRITQFIRMDQENKRIRIWQRGFYDHVVRNERDFIEKASYIENHPIREESNVYAEWH